MDLPAGMRQTPILSDLELAILGLVRERPRSGYELRKAFATTSIGDSPGSIYPALRRMRQAGLIEAASDLATRRGKETFHLTLTGRRALRDTLARRFTDEEIRRNPDAVMFRLPFIELELGREAAATFLADYGNACASRAAELKRERTILAEHDASVYAARARWAARAAKDLSRRRS